MRTSCDGANVVTGHFTELPMGRTWADRKSELGDLYFE